MILAKVALLLILLKKLDALYGLLCEYELNIALNPERFKVEELDLDIYLESRKLYEVMSQEYFEDLRAIEKLTSAPFKDKTPFHNTVIRPYTCYLRTFNFSSFHVSSDFLLFNNFKDQIFRSE